MKKAEFKAATMAEYQQKMKTLSAKHDGCWIASRAFDYIYARRYESASKIPYASVGDTPDGVYYSNGNAYQFSDAKQRKYDNSAMGCE